MASGGKKRCRLFGNFIQSERILSLLFAVLEAKIFDKVRQTRELVSADNCWYNIGLSEYRVSVHH